MTWKNLAKKLMEIPKSAESVKNDVAEAVTTPPVVLVTAWILFTAASEIIAFGFLS